MVLDFYLFVIRRHQRFFDSATVQHYKEIIIVLC